jgi:hypothetical protein
MIDLLSIILKIRIQTKNIIAKERCTVNRTLLFLLSFQPSLLLSPKRSIQKEEVRAVNAPSALGKSAEINPIIKMIPIASGRYCNATVGKRSSPIIFLPSIRSCLPSYPPPFCNA